MKVLLADDEEELARAVGAILKFNNYEVDIVNNGVSALNQVMKKVYDVLILDIMMPQKTGIVVVKEIRNKNIEVPILMLTAKAEVDDKIEGLDSGANDYLTKPFNKDELLARLRAITRVYQNKLKKITIGNVTLNKEESVLYTDKMSFQLNNKECQMLETLVNYQDKSIKKEELKNCIWGNDAEDEVVTMYITYLQNKFQALGANVVIKENNGYSLEKIL